MANLDDTPSWEAGIYQLEIVDPVLAGPGGIDNLQALQLGHRTSYLKGQTDALKNGSASYVADTGAVNALVATFTTPFTAYSAGIGLRLKVAVTNTGPATLVLDGMAPKGIKKFGGADLEAGDLVAGDLITLIYDGGAFQLQSPAHRIYSRKNLIMNGAFELWPRGTALAAGTGQRYLAERWVTASGGSTITPSQQVFATGQTDVPDSPAFFHRCVVASVAGATNMADLSQRIESVRTLAGKTATLSFWAKADANKTIAVYLSQNFGGGGAPSAAVVDIGATAIALTANWAKFTVIFAVPSLAGKTIGTDGNDLLGVGFRLDCGATADPTLNGLVGQHSGTFDFALVQLEEGPIATQFEHRPIGQELVLCSRFGELVPIYADYTSGLSSTALYRVYPFKVPKRNATLASTIVSAITYYSAGVATAVPSPVLNAGASGLQITSSGLTNAGGYAAGAVYVDNEL